MRCGVKALWIILGDIPRMPDYFIPWVEDVLDRNLDDPIPGTGGQKSGITVFEMSHLLYVKGVRHRTFDLDAHPDYPAFKKLQGPSWENHVRGGGDAILAVSVGGYGHWVAVKGGRWTEEGDPFGDPALVTIHAGCLI